LSRSLILFDIDGTLISGCGEGIEPFVSAIRDVCGIRAGAELHDTAGKTDRLILRELLRRQGVIPEQSEELRMLRRYLMYVRALIQKTPGRILPGVRMFLQRFGREEHFNIGLGTGNLEAVARLKLRLHGLDEFFETGGFGDDALCRKDVIAAGIRKARRRYGTDFERVIVIGDTPRDIEASKAVGVYSVAVATGSYLFSQLRAHNPTILIRDMSEPEMVIEQLQSKAR
jgi:phosphoglycolate phosphatase